MAEQGRDGNGYGHKFDETLWHNNDSHDAAAYHCRRYNTARQRNVADGLSEKGHSQHASLLQAVWQQTHIAGTYRRGMRLYVHDFNYGRFEACDSIRTWNSHVRRSDDKRPQTLLKIDKLAR